MRQEVRRINVAAFPAILAANGVAFELAGFGRAKLWYRPFVANSYPRVQTMPANKFAVAMFDMDGLLLDTERVIFSAFTRTRRHFGLSDSPEVFLNCVGIVARKSRLIIKESLIGSDVTLEAFLQHWESGIETALARDVPRKPGAMELFQRLSAQSVPIGIGTSTPAKTAKHHLELAGLLPFVTHVIGGDMVEENKPAPETYQRLAALFGADPHECVVFEDSAAGTRAGVASGATTVQIPDLIEPTAELIELGHVIAPDLLAGARQVGLLAEGG